MLGGGRLTSHNIKRDLISWEPKNVMHFQMRTFDLKSLQNIIRQESVINSKADTYTPEIPKFSGKCISLQGRRHFAIFVEIRYKR